jgi:CBS domain-containing protein
MQTTAKDFASLTAGDLMSEDLLLIPRDLPMADAARLLLRSQVSGAPVVDECGRWVGILSTTDFVARTERNPPAAPGTPALAMTCGFQKRTSDSTRNTVVACTLPANRCPMQRPGTGSQGEPLIRCSEPHAVPTDWQMVNVKALPADSVDRYMTTDLVTATPATLIAEVARRMIDNHIHRLVVVDDQLGPIGIISSTDILAAVAAAGRSQ